MSNDPDVWVPLPAPGWRRYLQVPMDQLPPAPAYHSQPPSEGVALTSAAVTPVIEPEKATLLQEKLSAPKVNRCFFPVSEPFRLVVASVATRAVNWDAADADEAPANAIRASAKAVAM